MKVKIPLQIIELEKGNFHIIATGKFNDGATVYWAIDTGASKTVFDKTRKEYYTQENDTEEIHSAGIGEKKVVTTLGSLKNFHLGKFKIEHLKVALINLSHINELYNQATSIEICGLIGGDFLMKYSAMIDYKRKILSLNI